MESDFRIFVDIWQIRLPFLFNNFIWYNIIKDLGGEYEGLYSTVYSHREST